MSFLLLVFESLQVFSQPEILTQRKTAFSLVFGCFWGGVVFLFWGFFCLGVFGGSGGDFVGVFFVLFFVSGGLFIWVFWVFCC